MRYLAPPYDVVSRVLAVLFVVSVIGFSAYAVGKTHGVHEQRMRAWKDCAAQHEQAAARARVQIVRSAMPCESR
jgi:hypothetical protein